jgi:hypothetical protein
MIAGSTMPAMIEPTFNVVGARVEPHAAVPTLMLTLAIDAPAGRELEGLALSCQLRLEPTRRSYSTEETARLVDLFGAAPRWSSTMKPLPWVDASVLVPAFSDRVEVELPIPCSYDLEVSAARYFQSLDEGEVPLRLLFRGTIFARGERGLEMTPLPWRCEAAWRLPVALWRAAIDGHFPDAGWLRLRKRTIERLVVIKGRHALATFDDVVEMLLAEVAEVPEVQR